MILLNECTPSCRFFLPLLARFDKILGEPEHAMDALVFILCEALPETGA